MKNLKKYQKIHDQNEGYGFGENGKKEVEKLNFQTIWIPVWSGNRTATYNLNHKVDGFNNDGQLFGRNGNCDTPYIILEVPKYWNYQTLHQLSVRVAKKLEKSEDYPLDRVLKADERLLLIIEEIKLMTNV
jgi:hypothetical protein